MHDDCDGASASGLRKNAEPVAPLVGGAAGRWRPLIAT